MNAVFQELSKLPYPCLYIHKSLYLNYAVYNDIVKIPFATKFPIGISEIPVVATEGKACANPHLDLTHIPAADIYFSYHACQELPSIKFAKPNDSLFFNFRNILNEISTNMWLTQNMYNEYRALPISVRQHLCVSTYCTKSIKIKSMYINYKKYMKYEISRYNTPVFYISEDKLILDYVNPPYTFIHNVYYLTPDNLRITLMCTNIKKAIIHGAIHPNDAEILDSYGVVA